MDTPPLIERLLGPNWRTTLSGTMTAVMSGVAAIAALPYTMGGDALLIPPEWKSTVFRISAAAAVISKVWNAMSQKDRQVSGTPGTGQVVGIKNEEPRKVEPQS
jgi:hypothetical protein